LAATTGAVRNSIERADTLLGSARRAMTSPRLNAEQQRGGSRRGCSVLCRLEDCYRNKINPAEAHQMAKQPTPDIASLRVRERMLLFCVGGGTDWQCAGVTGETVTALCGAGPYHGSRDVSPNFWRAEAGVAPGL
jgi:hypothetical protein